MCDHVKHWVEGLGGRKYHYHHQQWQLCIEHNTKYFTYISYNSQNCIISISSVQFSCSVVSDSLWSHGLQHASLPSITNSQSLLKLMSIESVIPSNHLILCCPLLLPSIFPSIRVFSNESVLCIRWPEYWSFSFSISPSNEYSELISFTVDWFDSRDSQESSPIPQFKSISSLALSFLYSPTFASIHDYWINHSLD